MLQVGVEPGYPLAISSSWAGLPPSIDAAFTWPNNNATYFFKGTIILCHLKTLQK
jgi:hypothetical protein